MWKGDGHVPWAMGIDKGRGKRVLKIFPNNNNGGDGDRQ